MELPLELLRSFVAAAESGSFTRAAGVVNRTQSAVSMQMKRLEGMVGRPLFDRKVRGVSLTPAGTTLLDYSRRMLKLHDEALDAVCVPDMEGVVRLGSPEDYATTRLTKVLSDFAHAYPRVAVEVTCHPSDRLMNLFQAGELDLTLCTDEDAAGGELLRRESVVWVCGEDSQAHEEDPLPLAVFHEGCLFRRWATTGLENMGRAYRVAYSSPSVAGLLAAVRTGLAVVPLGSGIVPADLRVLGPEHGLPLLPEAAISLHRGAGVSSAPVEGLAGFLRSEFRSNL